MGGRIILLIFGHVNDELPQLALLEKANQASGDGFLLSGGHFAAAVAMRTKEAW